MRFIPSTDMKPGMILSKSIYDINFHLLLNQGNQLSERYIQRIRELGYQGIYIEDDLSNDLSIADIVSEKTRMETYHLNKKICDQAIKYATDKKSHFTQITGLVNELERLVITIIADLKERNVQQINLIDIKMFSDFIVSHNVNVGILSLYLGMAYGLDELQLKRLGIAALLHDVGKMFIDPKILNKKEQLTPEEMETIQKHPIFSYEYLKESYVAHPQSYLAALYHHERIDGSGYPGKKKGKDIPLYAKIISIADVYDALTSKRPNREPRLPSEAMEYMMGNGATAFDMDLLTLFTRKVAPYPIGLEVQLNTGLHGLIIKNYADTNLRPVLRIFTDTNGKEIQPFTADLREDPQYRNVTII